ncbi:hypothetical protein [Paenibacillus sp. HB172176]|uniref:hypothetical protein n=1 Tax=Paenibacillus sp. HB172176 TaxID=2493690 RepID=UPI00143C1639|nr:hypothetical protein [Paenibacillus sp. HB172176]
MDTTAAVIFIIAAFSLGVIIIMKRDSLPQRSRRTLALLSITLIAFAFFFIVYYLFNLGA